MSCNVGGVSIMGHDARGGNDGVRWGIQQQSYEVVSVTFAWPICAFALELLEGACRYPFPTAVILSCNE